MTALMHIAIVAAIAGEPQGSCPVRVVPENASAAWLTAASALARTLRSPVSGDRDCREVIVHAASDPSVEVTTSDGRHGVRRLADARDLEPTVTALIVTVPPEFMSETPTLTAPAAPPPAVHAWQLFMFAGGGGRLRLPSTPAPVLELMVGTLRRPWELALYGGWVPTVVRAGATEKAGFSSTAELGLSAARRHPLGSVDLIVGARAAAVVLWGHTNDSADATGGGNAGEVPSTVFAPAVSAFVGTSIPFLSRLKLRPQVSFQWIPLGVTSAEPTSSIWSVGFGLGAESGTP
jgi:hypothetical protein